MLRGLLDKYAPPDSELAKRCADEPSFLRWPDRLCVELSDAYKRSNQQDYDEFRKRLIRWVKNPGSDYISFIGEMLVAQRLIKHDVPHRFIPETDAPTPDVELSIGDNTIFFEIATMEEDTFYRFADKVANRMESLLPEVQVNIMPLYLRSQDDEMLVEKVVNLLKQANSATESRTLIEVEEPEGICSLVAFWKKSDSPNPVGSGFNNTVRVSWPEGRVLGDGTHFIEYKLKQTLKEKQKQFGNDCITFLIWVNLDHSLEGFRSHVPVALEDEADTRYANVAGIIVDDDFSGWIPIINEAYWKTRNADVPHTIIDGLIALA